MVQGLNAPRRSVNNKVIVMPVTATSKDTGISVKKLLPILNLVRGRNIEEALSILEFMTSPAAANVAKVVKSANSNAESEMLNQGSDLRIVEIYANEGRRLKRFRARARGRVGKIIRRNSHITVVVGEVGGD
jgi:large subunit ribosomal protein L22